MYPTIYIIHLRGIARALLHLSLYNKWREGNTLQKTSDERMTITVKVANDSLE